MNTPLGQPLLGEAGAVGRAGSYLLVFCFSPSLIQILSRATFPMKKVMAKLRLYQSLQRNRTSTWDPRPAPEDQHQASGVSAWQEAPCPLLRLLL